MSTLIVLGNPNQYTFANSIIAANNKSIDLFGKSLKDIFVIHSSISYNTLTEKKDWTKHLESNNINIDTLTHRIVDLNSSNESVEKFVHYVEFIANAVSSKNLNVIVDLTNSTSLYKNLLSIAAYILDLEHQYIINIAKVTELTKEKEFLPISILQETYIPLPSVIQLDKIAYLSLVEMVRYKRMIQSYTDKYTQIDPIASDRPFFEDNLVHSVQLKLQGDQGDRKKNNAIYRIVGSSIAASVEDLITLLIKKFSLGGDSTDKGPLTFGKKLRLIEARFEDKAYKDFDFEFFKKFNDFMLYLRNSSTHKNTALADIERFKADLSVKMSFPFIEFYVDIIHQLLNNHNFTESPAKMVMKRLSNCDIPPGETFYFGLDGDDTGARLEELFLSARDDKVFEEMSKSVVKAVKEIENYIKSRKGSKVLFAAGDDILFKANFDESVLRLLQEMYQAKASGLTCSIGYGKSFREVHLALKLAKLEPGKNSIVGIEFV